MDAVVITIGDEILIGQITDTNSSYIAKQLNSLGIRVLEILSISDDKNHIINTLNKVVKEDRLVVITGGLGPTNDDITKKVLSEYTGATKMITNEEQLALITETMVLRKMDMNNLNRLQADVPETCKVLLNRKGTAPGMWFDYKGAVLVSLPGVPFEMHHLMEQVVHKLKECFDLQPIYHRSLMTFGYPESNLAEKLAPWEIGLPLHIKLAYLPHPVTGVKLRLSVFDRQLSTNVEQEVEHQINVLKRLLGSAIYGEDPDTIELVAGRLLQAKGATLATAESCTGGKIASLITSVPGSSAYFKGGIIAYDNSIKVNVLGVSPETLALNGAVSRKVVQQMAEGIRQVMQTDYAVATSGVAGPEGG
ncbi:MAG: CinA family nicotinamide mononucleotide deamidase-related protein, partial [Prevotellaceae bacterium]|nr:CinA family nicotinamide mononucleotide deamidase-related protein [Prevotellaceae bacterium]